MAWDFSTPPEVQAELDWMREFVNENVIPLELLLSDVTQAQMDAIFAPLKEQVKQRGLWAAHLPPEDGGQGRGQMHLALMHEVLGRSDLAPEVFGCQGPDSGNAELIAAGANEASARNGCIRCCAANCVPPFPSPSSIIPALIPPAYRPVACVMATRGC